MVREEITTKYYTSDGVCWSDRPAAERREKSLPLVKHLREVYPDNVQVNFPAICEKLVDAFDFTPRAESSPEGMLP